MSNPSSLMPPLPDVMSETTSLIGVLEKMAVHPGPPVQYALPVGDARVPLNGLIGQRFGFTYTGRIFCAECGRKTNKSFGEGSCYRCFTTLAAADICYVRPERCHFAAGTCRQPEWALSHCMQPHIVYLANSSGVKVGITREGQIPTRWMDQGAVQGLPILRVKTRFHSGLVEVLLGEHVTDRTDWRKMLKGDVEAIDLPAQRDALLALCAPKLNELRESLGPDALELLPEAGVTTLSYPGEVVSGKLTSFNLDKEPTVQGVLRGIKGQYLIFDEGVINIRKYTGYEISVRPA